MNKFLIKKPVISEKATRMAELGKYVFVVENSATGPEVKKALKEIYKVDVVRVNVINTRSKPKGGQRFASTVSGYRKAIVTLKEGQKLDILPH